MSHCHGGQVDWQIGDAPEYVSIFWGPMETRAVAASMGERAVGGPEGAAR